MQRSCGMMGYHLITAGDLGYPEFGIKISIKFLNSWMGTTWGCCDFSGPARAGPGWPIAGALCPSLPSGLFQEVFSQFGQL